MSLKTALKLTFLLSSKLLFFIAFKVSITNESNNKKIFICVNFYIAKEKLCEYKKVFGKKSKNRDKYIQSGTLGQHTKIQDCWNVWLFINVSCFLKTNAIFFSFGFALSKAEQHL